MPLKIGKFMYKELGFEKTAVILDKLEALLAKAPKVLRAIRDAAPEVGQGARGVASEVGKTTDTVARALGMKTERMRERGARIYKGWMRNAPKPAVTLTKRPGFAKGVGIGLLTGAVATTAVGAMTDRNRNSPYYPMR